MKACSSSFIFISLSLLLLMCEAPAASEQFQATVYKTLNDSTLICHGRFMSVYISKAHFADLPFTIYVEDKHSGYYQAIALVKRCHYFLGETDTSVVLTVASHGCFVRRHKYITHLTVVIMAPPGRGRVEIVKSIPLVCERKIKEVNKNDNAWALRHLSCNKHGFNITIPQNATVPPLNLDAVSIPSGQSHCKPNQKSKDAVIFSFPFTECDTQSMVADGIITYWVNIEVNQHPHSDSIFRGSRLHFALAQITHLGIGVEEEKFPSMLKSEGPLRIEMRFAKDSSYRSFYSSRDPPTVTGLGQPMYVEVFVLKYEDKDFMLLLQDCWATPTKNPHDPLRWNLLVKGCPFDGDSHRTVVLPVVSSKDLKHPSLHKWFVVKLFSFVEPHTFENQVYFHCDVELCKGPDCTQSCNNGRQKFRRIPPEPGQTIISSVVSGEPFVYLL